MAKFERSQEASTWLECFVKTFGTVPGIVPGQYCRIPLSTKLGTDQSYGLVCSPGQEGPCDTPWYTDQHKWDTVVHGRTRLCKDSWHRNGPPGRQVSWTQTEMSPLCEDSSTWIRFLRYILSMHDHRVSEEMRL
jgi:hypothetical protein